MASGRKTNLAILMLRILIMGFARRVDMIVGIQYAMADTMASSVSMEGRIVVVRIHRAFAFGSYLLESSVNVVIMVVIVVVAVVVVVVYCYFFGTATVTVTVAVVDNVVVAAVVVVVSKQVGRAGR